MSDHSGEIKTAGEVLKSLPLSVVGALGIVGVAGWGLYLYCTQKTEQKTGNIKAKGKADIRNIGKNNKQEIGDIDSGKEVIAHSVNTSSQLPKLKKL